MITVIAHSPSVCNARLLEKLLSLLKPPASWYTADPFWMNEYVDAEANYRYFITLRQAQDIARFL